MAQTQYIAGFAIEGVGLNASSPLGTVWAYGDLGAIAMNDGDYDYVSALAKLPDSADTSIDPFDGTVNTSNLPLELANTYAVATTIQPTTTDHEWVLQASVSDSATTIDLGETGASGVVWVGDECILLDTDFFDGTYSCTRGYWDTDASAHSAGEHVYDGVPYWRDRRVKFILYNVDTDTRQVIWRGYIQDIATNEKSTRLVLQCGELLGAWKSSEVGRASEPLDHGIEIQTDTVGNVIDRFPRGVLAPDGGYASQVRKQAAWSADGRPTFLQIDGSLALANNTSGTLEVDPALTGLLGTGIQSEPEEDGATSWPVEDKVHEVLVVSRDIDRRVEGLGITETYSSTADLKALGDHYVYHPYALGAALAMSSARDTPDPLTFDVLGPNFGLGLGWAFSGGALGTLQQYIDETPNLQIDHAVLGWDGEPFNAWDVAVYRCWMPFGILPVPQDNGLLTFRRFGLMDIRQYNQALGNKVRAIVGGRLQQKMAHGSTMDTVTARFGDLPWRDEPSRVIVNSEGNSRRAGALADGGKFELDYGFIAEENIESVLNNLITQSVLAHYTMPRLWITCEAPEQGDNDYTLGEYAALEEHPTEDKLLVGPDRERIDAITADIPWCGFMYGRRPNYAKRTYDLGLILTNFRIQQVPRLRGPAMDLTLVGFGDERMYCADDSQYGYLDDQGDAAADNESFYVGDQVRPWTPDGTLRDAEAIAITDIGTDGEGPYIQLASPWTTTPVVGDTFRLASFDDYSNTTPLDNVDRVWAYLADANGQLGTAGEAGDRYGSEFAAGSSVDTYGGAYDGLEYVGVDSDAAAADESEDTYLDHKLRNNEFYLYQNGDNVCTNRLVPSDGVDFDPLDRIITSLSWSEFDGGGIPLWPGMDTITVNVLGGVLDGDTEVFDATVQIRARVIAPSGGFSTVGTFADTRTGGADIRPMQLVLSVPTIPRKERARLVLEVRGVVGSAAGSAEDPEVSNGGFNVTLTGTYGEAIALLNEDGAPLTELIGEVNTGATHHVYPLMAARSSVTPHHMGALVYRSASVEFGWKGGGAGFVEYASEGVRAGKTVTFSGGSGYHFQNLDMLGSRPRVQGFGLRGFISSSEAVKYAHHEFASSGVAGWQTIRDSSLSIDSDDPVMSLEFDVITDAIIQAQPLDRGEPFASLLEQSPRAQWQFRATAYQLEDGQTWANATQVGQKTITKTMTCFARPYGGPWLYLLGGDNEYRSDQLYPDDRQLITPLAIPLEMSGADKSQPVRVLLEAKLLQVDDWGAFPNSTSANLIASLVRFGAIEYPQ